MSVGDIESFVLEVTKRIVDEKLFLGNYKCIITRVVYVVRGKQVCDVCIYGFQTALMVW